MAKVVLFSLEIVGKSMAGPGIRYWEMAQALSKKHEVTLISPNLSDLESSNFTIRSSLQPNVGKIIGNSDVVISQQIPYSLAIIAKRRGTRMT